MIIIRTKNGNKFINDRMIAKAEHDKEKAEFVCHIEGALLRYNEVEEIIYTNGTKMAVWKDESSELERLNAELSVLRNAKDFYNDFKEKVFTLHRELNEALDQNNRLCETNKKLRAKLAQRTIWQWLGLEETKQQEL